jgi:hypothetical protein
MYGKMLLVPLLYKQRVYNDVPLQLNDVQERLLEGVENDAKINRRYHKRTTSF